MNRIEKLNEFLQASPGDSFLKHALALEHIKQGNEKEAKGLFEEILAADAGYIGSYYHLAKLLERANDVAAAEIIYTQGMTQAQLAGDTHSFNELRSAHEELTL